MADVISLPAEVEEIISVIPHRERDDVRAECVLAILEGKNPVTRAEKWRKRIRRHMKRNRALSAVELSEREEIGGIPQYKPASRHPSKHTHNQSRSGSTVG